MAFGGYAVTRRRKTAVARSAVAGELYQEIDVPRSGGLLTFDEDPAFFVDRIRRLDNTGLYSVLIRKPEYTMLGRTYSLGYEPDLVDVLMHRPRRTVLNRDWPWAVWYPLRRSGRFAQLPVEEQRTILAEHGAIGMSYGAGDYAHDIRLACYGLDKNDNDFVIGLLGKELFPLSHIVQAMRKTQQTSLYLDRLGPFFVGRAVWQSPQ